MSDRGPEWPSCFTFCSCKAAIFAKQMLGAFATKIFVHLILCVLENLINLSLMTLLSRQCLEQLGSDCIGDGYDQSYRPVAFDYIYILGEFTEKPYSELLEHNILKWLLKYWDT